MPGAAACLKASMLQCWDDNIHSATAMLLDKSRLATHLLPCPGSIICGLNQARSIADQNTVWFTHSMAVDLNHHT